MTTPLAAWTAHMRFTGAARTTIANRTRTLRRFEREHGDLLTRTKTDAIAFLSAYSEASSRSTMLSYLRSFYGWALAEGLIDADPMEKVPSVRVPAGSPRPADHEDVVALLNTAKPRTRTMALLMLYAGLRCCEVSAFRPDHLAQQSDGGWWVVVPHGKGGKAAAVPIPHDIAEEIKAAPAWDVSTQTVQKAVRDALKAVGSSATPHQLRHYYGTSVLKSTQNLRYTQDMMRHSSPTSTARYTKVTSEELSSAAESLPRIA